MVYAEDMERQRDFAVNQQSGRNATVPCHLLTVIDFLHEAGRGRLHLHEAKAGDSALKDGDGRRAQNTPLVDASRVKTNTGSFASSYRCQDANLVRK